MSYIVVLGALMTLCDHVYGASTGLVELDELSFDKILSKFPVAIVKFDIAYPYGEKHEIYQALATDMSEYNDVVVATVGIKDYGDYINQGLAKRFGVAKDDYPLVKLFVKGNRVPIEFTSKEFTAEELRRFIRTNSGMYVSLPGCVNSLDKLAIKFMETSGEKRQDVLNKLNKAIKGLKDKEAESGSFYKLTMEKIIEKGDSFIETEIERLKKLLSGKLTTEKQLQVKARINILETFKTKEIFDGGHDEL